ncbi:siderophore ABC transporter substrate-binding protein [Xanthobacter sp. V2C-8]|uniref:siderophore ABC transporter substrate-binding protein n=1 Tax=Xanthobacter albus TaxID=3119929 RepID=UPI0037281EDE
MNPSAGPSARAAITRRCVAALALLALFAAAPSFSPASAAPVSVKHARGEAVLPARPARVVVFDAGALDTLDALGVEVAGVPGSNLPQSLAKYRDDRYAKVGTLFEPDYEAVAALAPDLIIIGGRSAPKYAELAKIAPTIDLTVDPKHFVAGVRANAQTLGRLFGKEQEAAALDARIDAGIAAVRAEAPKAGRVLMIMVNGGKLSAYGAGSRFGWIHGDLGLTPLATGKEADTHGDVISFEYLLKANPDWLLVLDRDVAIGQAAAAARSALDNDIVAATTAAKENHIVYLDAPRWYVTAGGARALALSVEELAAALRGAPKAGPKP